jgi:putative endopeptidase
MTDNLTTDSTPSLLPYADPSIRVQDSLFLHTNGQWLATHEIPADRGGDGAFTQLRDDAEAAVRAIIERAAAQASADKDVSDDDDDAARARRIGALYGLFMDEESINAQGAAPLEPLFAEVDAVNSTEDFVRLTGVLHRSGVGSAANLFVSIDALNPTLNRIYAVQGGLSLPDESYYREEEFRETREKFQAHLTEFFPLVGLEAAPATLMDLETKIAAGHWDKVRSRDAVKRHNPFTAAEFAERWPLLQPWLEASGATEAQREVVVVWQPEALDAVQDLLRSEPLEAWKLWLKTHVAHFAAPYLSQEIAHSNWSFYGKVLSGATEQRDRWKRGVAFVESAVGEDLGALYVAEHFPESHKEAMLELVDYLLKAYRESISSLDWMSEATREKALVKLSKFTTKIGYPDEWTDYSAVTVDPQSLLRTAMSANEAATDRELAKIDTGVTGKEWLMNPQTVNAYYMPPANEIVFPAAILRPPFFDAEADAAVNFAGIGAVIGHEIGHGFDDQGSRYNGDGQLENWWTEEDLAAFTERTARLVGQFEGLHPTSAPDASINGELTLGENIGDLGGLSIGLKAYRLYLADHGLTLETAPVIEGTTAAQRFFYSWATIWRSKNRPETARQLATVDPHSPAEFRADEPPKNIDAFHEAFGTQPGDGMYRAPEERVSIW